MPGEQDVGKDKYIQPYEMERLYSPGQLRCDILLTHDVALHARSLNYGMEEIRLILDAYKPAYHFHGHTEEPFTKRIDENGKTTIIKMADLHWDKSTSNWSIEEGSMGILRWTNAEIHSFSVVEAEWFNEYNAKSWSHID